VERSRQELDQGRHVLWEKAQVPGSPAGQQDGYRHRGMRLTWSIWRPRWSARDGMGRRKGRHASVAEDVAVGAEMHDGVGVTLQHGRVFSGEVRRDGVGELGERRASVRHDLDGISFTVRGQGRRNHWIE
jgi:hypothetical protein